MGRVCKCRVTKEIGDTNEFVKIEGYYYKSQEIYNEYIKNKAETISGIYSITNISNNTVYIGESFNIYSRWKEHVKDLSNNKHCNYLLQKDFLNAPDNFKYEIIQIYKTDNAMVTKCHLLMLEHKYIKKYEKNNVKLYNLEYTLEKLLNNDRTVFQSFGFSPTLFNILINQIVSYKFIEDENEFKLIIRDTPTLIFNKLAGYKTTSKYNQKFKDFMEILNYTYKNDLSKIIKTYTFKYKLLGYDRVKKIDEVTEYGNIIFKEIINNNIRLINKNTIGV